MIWLQPVCIDNYLFDPLWGYIAMTSIECTGETVEEAVAAGLQELGVTVTDVIVEVLEEPSRGVFGIGAREARVRLQLIGRAPQASAAPIADVGDDDDDSDDEVSEDDAKVGREVLLELLDKMRIRADVDVRRADPTRDGEPAPWMLDVSGQAVNSLIGKRGETLASLQYITRLITSRRLQRRANIIIDVDGYKSRRSERLRALALRMADQCVQQGRTITLEPMPPNERRIIHLTLRNRADVTTRSVGEGDSRKVTIVPK